MDDSARRIADGLVTAMKAEAEGHHFYLMAARTTEDPRGREVFERLAQEELDHFSFLKQQHAAVTRTGKGDAAIKLGNPATFEGESPIFSDKIKARIGDAHFEMTALSVGVQLELNAEQYYKWAASEAEDDVVKKFYTELAAWEAGHYRALLNQQETLREAYWSASGFAPF